jgi:ABC-2 type transport system permease protein
MLRPVNIQFLASFRTWQPFRLIDLALGLAVLVWAMGQPGQSLTLGNLALFVLLLGAGTVLVYGILLAFTALTFWNPGFLFTWVFDAVFQLARYPIGIYPAWLRILLTWAVPVGLVTTVPAQALSGDLPAGLAAGSLIMSAAVLAGASLLFRAGVRRYASASS